jgi:antitoxin (DNA-binding transcriptional repressor) of toxin-antitoxin stability system
MWSTADYPLTPGATDVYRRIQKNTKVIDDATAGQAFVVTRNGEPVAELRPIRAGRRTFITRDEGASLAGATVRIDHRRFRDDLDR